MAPHRRPADAVTGLPAALGVAAACALGLAAMAVLSPVRAGHRLLVLALAGALLASGAAGAWVLVGRPQPTTLSLAAPAEPWLDVLFADWTEGESIHVLVRGANGAPRLYALPWQRSLAEQLQDAIARARDREGVLKMADVFRLAGPELARRTVFVSAPVVPPALAGTDPRDARGLDQ